MFKSNQHLKILFAIFCLLAVYADAQVATRGGVAPLKGTVPQAALTAQDSGALPASAALPELILFLARTPSQSDALQKLLVQQQTPGNPNYHRWLSPEEYGAQFGISPAAEATLGGWLKAQGFQHVTLSRSRTAFRFSGTAGSANTAFHTSLHRMSVGGVAHYANVTDLTLPSTIAPLVAHVGGLNDFGKQPAIAQSALSVSPQFTQVVDSYDEYLMAPGDMAVEFDLTPLTGIRIDGTGVTAVVIGTEDIDMTNVDTYRADYGLPANTPTSILVNSNPTLANNLNATEAYGDLELLGAVAPNAHLIYVHDANLDNAFQYAIDQKIGSVISFSYDAPESPSQPGYDYFWQTLAQQANAEGITIVASSGDFGAAGWNGGNGAGSVGELVQDPVNIPEITGVGGTQLNSPMTFGAVNDSNGGSLTRYNPESAWDEAGVYNGGPVDLASGGGASKVFPKPAWQQGSGVPSDGFRDVPDVAMYSGYGVVYGICVSGDCAQGPPDPGYKNGTFFTGTSAAAPVFAGVVVLLNQYLVQQGTISTPGLGNINPNLYRLAANTSNVFHDIVTGSNIVPCNVGTPDCPTAGGPLGSSQYGSYGYQAGPGYDQVTGLGSVDAYNLVTEWGTDLQIGTTTSISSNLPTILNGDNLNLQLTAKVVANASGGTPDGSVSFYSSTGQGYYPVALIGTAQLAGDGTATLSVPSLAPLVSEVYAEYGGSWTYSQSLAGALAVHTPSTTTLQASAASVTVGTAVQLTATVSGAGPTPTGSVEFFNGQVLLGSAQLSQGQGRSQGSITVSSLQAGNDTITAVYQPDTVYATSTSAPVTVVVTASPAATTTVLTASASQITANAQVTLTAAVSSPGATVTDGSVTFLNGSTSLGTATVVNGVAQLTTSALPTGTDPVTASYGGTSAYAASTSAPVTITVVAPAPASTTTVLTPSATQIAVNAQVTLTAAVSSPEGNVTGGTVTFLNGTTSLGTADVTNGVAQLATTALALGTNPVTASYGGTVAFAPSTSAPVSITVVQPDFKITATPTSLTVTGGGTGTSTLNIVPENGFAETPALSCAGLPSGANCTFGTSEGQADGSSNVTLTIAIVALTGASRPITSGSGGYYLAILPMLLAVFTRRRKAFLRALGAVSALLVVGFVAGLTGCGGGGAGAGVSTTPPKSQTSTVTVSAVSKAGITHTVNLTLTVN